MCNAHAECAIGLARTRVPLPMAGTPSFLRKALALTPRLGENSIDSMQASSKAYCLCHRGAGLDVDGSGLL